MSNTKMRVVLFADILEEDYDGVSVTLNKILASAPKGKMDYLVVTSHPPKNLEGFPFPIIICPYLKLPFQKGYRLGLPSRQKDLKQRMDDFNPDIIHFTSPSKFGTYGIQYAEKANIPVVSIYHTHFPRYVRYYLGRLGTRLIGGVFIHHFTWYYKKANLVLVPTKPIQGDLENLGVDPSKMVIWGRSVKTDVFNPSYRDENLFADKIPTGGKKILFVSRLIKEKETATIMKVYERLKQVHSEYTVVITGEGPEQEKMEEHMPDAIFTGRQVGENLSKIYASCDVFFFPSTTETFGNVVLEAQAAGLPVVAARAGGPIDLVLDGERGYLVKPRDVEEFCDRIIKILEDDKLRKMMSEKAVEFASHNSSEALYQQLWSYYERAISEYQSK